MQNLKLIVSACLIALSIATHAENLTDIDQIVTAANHAAFYQGEDGKASARMLIVDSQGRKQFRQFSIARKNMSDEDSDQYYFVHFQKPSDVKKTAFLVNKHLDKDDDRWLYLPSLDLVKRIAAGDKRTSFVGSHFYYEDVSGRQLDEDIHTLIKTTEEHYIIEGTPKDKSSVEFSRYQAWIRKDNFLPIKTVYFDNQNKEYRKVEAIEVKNIGGYPTAIKVRVDDFNSKEYTLMELRDVKYNVGLNGKDFSERALRNPPTSLID